MRSAVASRGTVASLSIVQRHDNPSSLLYRAVQHRTAPYLCVLRVLYGLALLRVRGVRFLHDDTAAEQQQHNTTTTDNTGQTHEHRRKEMSDERQSIGDSRYEIGRSWYNS